MYPSTDELVSLEEQTADVAARTLPAGVPALGSMYLYVSGGCNLACRHCWITPTFQPNGANAQNVDLDYVRKAIEEGKPAGLHSIKLTGGEPTLHPQFRELVELIHDAGLAQWMETNGTLIDDSLAEFLADKKMLFISVSLDGATAETHDWMRNVPGSFDRAVNGIKALVKAGYSPQIICTLHRGNASELEALVSLAQELGCGSVKINIPQQIGRGVQFIDKQGFGIAEILDIYHWMHGELGPKYGVSIRFDVPFAFRAIGDFVTGALAHCGVRNIIGMLSNGDIALCGIGTSVPDLVYGHIERDNLFDVWSNSPGLEQLREQVPGQLEGICGRCIHRSTCLGSCVANNYFRTGTLVAPYDFCQQAEEQGLFPQSRTHDC